mgnify:FL=1
MRTGRVHLRFVRLGRPFPSPSFHVNMAADTPSAVHSFDLKSAELPVLAVTLRSTEVEQVIAD